MSGGNPQHASLIVEMPLDVVGALLQIADAAGATPAAAWVAMARALALRHARPDRAVALAIRVDNSSLHPLAVDTSGTLTLIDLLERVQSSARAVDGLWNDEARRVVLLFEPLEQLVPESSPGLHDTALDRRLTLVIERGDSSRLTFEFDNALCDASAVARLGRRWITLMREAVARPRTAVRGLQMLSQDELTEAQHIAGPACGYPSGTVAALFEAQVAMQPDAVALWYEDETVSYGALNARANQIAHRLQQRYGVQPETRIGVCLERSPAAIAGILGILKAGGAYVALGPEEPRARREALLTDANVRVTLTSRAACGQLPDIGRAVEVLDDDATWASEPTHNVWSAVRPEDAAYVLYTSGSTGAPKAIVGVHRSITNGLNAVPFASESENAVCELHSSLGVGFTMSRLFLPLLCGRPLVVASERQSSDLAHLVDLWEATATSNVAVVTPVLGQLVRGSHTWRARLAHVRTIVVGGAVVAPDLAAAFVAEWPGTTLLNGYAATEIGGAALLRTSTAETTEAANGAVGRPFANTHVYIVNEGLALQPCGATGEVCVAAAHLARGYLARPKLTAERFVPDPWGPAGARLYRTGDAGRVLSNGEVAVTGRLDDQVKVRGYRVELPAIEATLASHPAVTSAAVAAQTVDGESRLVAYVVARSGAVPDVGELQRFVGERLPPFMIPARFRFLNSLPTTTLGKVDRGALPPIGSSRSLQKAYVAPRTPLESAVADIWARVLVLDQVGVTDHFLELGGDSLIAAKLVSEIEHRFGVRIPVMSVFARPTVGALAKELLQPQS